MDAPTRRAATGRGLPQRTVVAARYAKSTPTKKNPAGRSGRCGALIDHRSAPHSFDHFVVAREQRRRCFEVEYPQLVVCVLFRVSSTIGNRSVRFCTIFP